MRSSVVAALFWATYISSYFGLHQLLSDELPIASQPKIWSRVFGSGLPDQPQMNRSYFALLPSPPASGGSIRSTSVPLS